MTQRKTVHIGDVVIVRGGGTPSKSRKEFYTGNIPWVTPKDMKSWRISRARDNITDDAINDSATNLIPTNSVLLVNRSGILKHTLPIGLNTIPVAINQDLKALVCSKAIHPEFLARMIKASEPIVLSWVRATTADNFPIDNLKNLEIPLPPLKEQRRIAKILNQAEELRRLRRESIDRLNDAGHSIFYEMFGDVASNELGWEENGTLGDVADIVSGITKGRKVNGKSTREVPYLAVVNVQDRELRLEPLKTIEATEEEISRYRLKENDLLLTEGGDPDKLGRGTLWRGELAECIHQNHVFRVRLMSDSLDPIFLNWLVCSRRGKSYFLKSAKQTTGIASINMTQLRNFPMIIPPLGLQRDFALRISQVEQSIESLEASACRLDSLFLSLERRGFHGEL